MGVSEPNRKQMCNSCRSHIYSDLETTTIPFFFPSVNMKDQDNGIDYNKLHFTMQTKNFAINWESVFQLFELDTKKASRQSRFIFSSRMGRVKGKCYNKLDVSSTITMTKRTVQTNLYHNDQSSLKVKEKRKIQSTFGHVQCNTIQKYRYRAYKLIMCRNTEYNALCREELYIPCKPMLVNYSGDTWIPQMQTITP